ncbi:MAG: ribbon-helix-helix domain-containing protein [Pseudomonadota bacterium]
MQKRSISLKGHRTSIALEPEFWSALEALAKDAEETLPVLIARIDRQRLEETPTPGLASALRVFVLQSLVSAAD